MRANVIFSALHFEKLKKETLMSKRTQGVQWLHIILLNINCQPDCKLSPCMSYTHETLITSPSQLLQVRYLSWLLAGSLVLCLLAQVLHSLVFRQEVLLLRHFFPIGSLVWRLPERTGKRLTWRLFLPTKNKKSEDTRRQCLEWKHVSKVTW